MENPLAPTWVAGLLRTIIRPLSSTLAASADLLSLGLRAVHTHHRDRRPARRAPHCRQRLLRRQWALAATNPSNSIQSSPSSSSQDRSRTTCSPLTHACAESPTQYSPATGTH